MSKIKESDFKTMSLNDLFSNLAGPSRINRKNAAKYLAADIKENPQDYKDYIPNLIDALDRPEAQTRWECLDSLSNLVKVDAKKCREAIPAAEEALFDERTGFVRVSAIRFLCRYGASSKARSKEVWPIIKDGLEQFNGDIEYDNMLNYLIYFSVSNLDEDVKKEFKEFVNGSIENVAPTTKLRLERIKTNLNKRAKKSNNKTSASTRSNTSQKKNSKKHDKNTKEKKSDNKKTAPKNSNKKSKDNKSKKSTNKPDKSNKQLGKDE